MTPESTRRAIAELRGWTRCKRNMGFPPWKKGAYDHRRRELLPDYTRDLNAVHEFESAMLNPRIHPAWLCMDYDREIGHIVGTALAGYHATAAQKCEAILRVMGRTT